MSREIVLLVVIGSAPTPSVDLTARSDLGTPIRGASYSGRVLPAGGEPPYTYSVTGGALPPGMSLNASTGEVTGTPTTQGYYEFEVTMIDSLASTFAAVFALAVAGGIGFTDRALTNAEHGINYSTFLDVEGGTPPYSFSHSGPLPVNAGYVVSGTGAGTFTITPPVAPLAPFRYTFTMTATDTTGNTGSKMFSLIVFPPLILTTGALPDGLQGLPYDVRLYAQHGLANPYPDQAPALTWSISGTLPDGLLIDSIVGRIYGAPTTAGNYTFDIVATDTLGGTVSGTRQVTIHSVDDIDSVYTQAFGNGVDQSFTIVHGLNIPDWVPRSLQVYDQSSSPILPVDVDWNVIDGDTIEINTKTTPAADQYLVKICG